MPQERAVANLFRRDDEKKKLVITDLGDNACNPVNPVNNSDRIYRISELCK